MSFIKNIIYNILSLQEKFLTFRLNKTISIKSHSNRKKHFGDGFLLSLETVADSEKTKMEEELSLILKSCNYDPKLILEYIEKHNTQVFYIEKSEQLYSIGEDQGFIYPQKGWKALYLSLLTIKKARFKTNAMFILAKGEINKFYFIYHFYNWYAFSHNIEGLNTESQELLKKYLFNPKEKDFKTLQLADIYKLKDAIKQDKFAIEFVFKLCQQLESSKEALKKLKNDGVSI